MAIAVASFALLHRFFQEKFYNATGEAQWIWRDGVRMSKGDPAAFYAAADFEVPPGSVHTRINVAADPQYQLFVNGHEIGGAVLAVTGCIDTFDVTALVKPGVNRLVIATRSANGAGGLLASIDFGPMQRNMIATGESWEIFERFDPRIHRPGWRDRGTTPRVLGPPPYGRWDFLTRVERKLAAEKKIVVEPIAVEQFDTALPEIRTPSGVAVVVAKPVRARIFDFGPVQGYGRLTRGDTREAKVIPVRYANLPQEFDMEAATHPMVFAPGESTVVDPQIRGFRYIIVYDESAAASAMIAAR